VQARADLLRRELRTLTLSAGNDGTGGSDPGDAGETENLPEVHGQEALSVKDAVLSLDAAVDLTRTGDLWLFRGRSTADHAIRVVTNAPVNHVGMAVVLDDLPPLMWHAELSRGLLDVWTGTHHPGAQLHDLQAAVQRWSHRYHQRTWLRQLDSSVSREMEDAMLRSIARTNGTPFPAAAALAGRWLRGRVRRAAPVEATYCAEVVAGTYQSMGLLAGDRPTNYYDPGTFWSGDALALVGGARLGDEIRVDVPPPPTDA
jgi:hypothetical protein